MGPRWQLPWWTALPWAAAVFFVTVPPAVQRIGASLDESWLIGLNIGAHVHRQWGSQIVFTTAISAFASPTILGGGRVQVMPVAIYQNILGLNWPLGAVQSVTLLLLSLVLVAVFTRALAPRRSGR